MKNSLLVALSLVSISTYAATTDQLDLSGTVGEILAITVTGLPAATALNITAGETAKPVGSALEESNRLAGYVVKMSSANGGQLTNSSDTTQKTAYTVSYAGAAAVAPTTSLALVKTVASLTEYTQATSQILVDVTAYPTAPAGVYSDTLTLSISAN